MEKKNKKLMILVAVLLVGIGVSFAYFASSTLFKGEGAIANFTISEINGAELKVEGILNLDDTGIYPGHTNVASVKVTATGDNELIPYNLVWSGTNTINTPLNFTVYKTSTPIDVNASCTVKTKVVSGVQQIGEECTISNIENLGNEIASGTINKGDTKATLISDEFITAVTNGISYYYYIIIEYPNLDEEQNEDINGVLNGKIKAEESNTKPDINILAAYIADDEGNYNEVSDIPQEGYIINTSKSTCSNGAIPTWKDNGLFVSSLTKSGTSCYLYFDKAITIDNIVAGLNAKAETPDFSQVADTDEGVFKTSDGMYGGTTYYWRGAVENNYVKFAGFCWRIIRINGDGSLRLIYDGTTCHSNGTITEESIVVANQAYNSSSDQSNYVGWTYQGTNQRPITNGDDEDDSNAKTQTETWYNNNIGNDSTYSNKVADGKYCNDRDVGKDPNGTQGTYSPNGSSFYYAGFYRLSESYSPTFSCPSGDAYTLKVGAITADEVTFAGGRYDNSDGNSNNTSYYLYNGNYYCTMSPALWYDNRNASVFIVSTDGILVSPYLRDTSGFRPVINLRSDVTFSSGNGELNSPYIVQ